MEDGDRQVRATLAAVAKAAGVSKATASKVLNGRPSVALHTRKRVEDAIARLDYVPSTGPRDPRGDQVINVVSDTMVSNYSLQVLSGVLALAGDLGVDVVVGVLDPPARQTPLSRPWFARVAARQHLGVIVVSSELSPDQIAAARKFGLPLVSIDPGNPLSDGLVSIAATNFAGGTQATHHLIALGHRRIGFAGLPERVLASRERLHGYRNALELAGLPVDPDLIVHGGFTHLDGKRMTLDLLDRDDPPTAIFAACDGSAFGVFEAARLRGLRVPEDLSVVGFDDIDAAQWTSPALTTVRQPIVEMGRVAVRTLVNQARGQAPDSPQVLLATSLVVRESTAPPPA